MLPPGIEPGSPPSKACTLPIELSKHLVKGKWPVGKDGAVPLTAEATPPPLPLTMSPHLKTQSTDQIIRAVAVQWPRYPRPPTPWLACRMGGGGWGLLGRGCYSRRERGLQIHHKELIAILRPQCNS